MLFFGKSILYDMTWCDIVSYHITFYYMVLYDMLFYDTLFYSILFYSVLFYYSILLFYSIPFYSILILFYSILFHYMYYIILLFIRLYYTELLNTVFHCIARPSCLIVFKCMKLGSGCGISASSCDASSKPSSWMRRSKPRTMALL